MLYGRRGCNILLGTYVDILPDGTELWLDGGHNPQGGEVLAEWLKERADRPVYLICGMIKGKDPAYFLKPMAPYVTQLYAVAIPNDPQAQPPEKIEAAAKSVRINAVCAGSVENALKTIAGHAKTPATICICGSLYLAGKVLAANNH